MSEEIVNKWNNKKFLKHETTAERQERYKKWEEENPKRQWEVVWDKKHPFDGNKYPKPHIPEHERPAGTIIYTPHDCERPDAETLRIGTIWECHDYTKKNPEGRSQMCYDQWIVAVDENGNRRWELFKRSF